MGLTSDLAEALLAVGNPSAVTLQKENKKKSIANEKK